MDKCTGITRMGDLSDDFGKRQLVRQQISVPFLWEEKPGLPKKDWQMNTVAIDPSLVASSPSTDDRQSGLCSSYKGKTSGTDISVVVNAKNSHRSKGNLTARRTFTLEELILMSRILNCEIDYPNHEEKHNSISMDFMIKKVFTCF